MAESKAFGVHSEVGQLRKVMVCAPGRAHQRLTPSNCDALLFDDVLWVENAKRDHFDFMTKMRDRGIEVLEMHNLLEQTVAVPEAKKWIIDNQVVPNQVGLGLIDEIKSYLNGLSNRDLAETLIGGLSTEEFPEKLGGEMLTLIKDAAGVTEFAVKRIRDELLPRFPHVDDVVALEHGYGCGVAIDAPDAAVPIRTLRNISLNPNFGGEVMVVSLGCEKLQPERLLPPGSLSIVDERSVADVGRSAEAGLDVVCLQDEAHVGFMSMVDSIVRQAEVHLERLNARRRETVPASELVVGVQCGGSDAFSGVTANPAVGFCTDLLVRAGASVMFSEVTEVRDGIDQLTSRAATPEVAEAMIREMAWYDAYLKRGGADRSANTTPGNKKGGLSNIVEKAMGSIVKSGTAPISGVLAPGEKLRTRGLTYAATPASDFICGTLQLAAGMNLHVFTTGRGTPYGLAAVPVIKVATRSDLARRWHDLMDVNAGSVADGTATIEDVGWEMFRLMLEVASGRRKTWAEHWRLHNALVLFNPAPVT